MTLKLKKKKTSNGYQFQLIQCFSVVTGHTYRSIQTQAQAGTSGVSASPVTK